MRYSLVSRFRGTLLGALLGANSAKVREPEQPNFSEISKLMLLGTESLINLGRLDLDDWKQRQQTEFPDFNISSGISLKVVLATLPVALFFHENPLKLRQKLLQTYQAWGNDPVVQDGILAVGYTIAQSLTEKLDSKTLIPQIIAFVGDTPTSLPKKLLKVNDLLAEHGGIERVAAEFNTQEQTSSAIAIAFYYFLSTLEDFRLTVLRATHQQTRVSHSQTTGAIAGALSGAYNSTVGIPPEWRVLHSSANSPTGVPVNFGQMLELTDALLAVWSGVYDLPGHSQQLSPEGCIMVNKQNAISVFAAPRVIRSR